MRVGFAIVSMVGTNFHDSKLIKGDPAPGPNEIGPWAQVRSGPGPKLLWLVASRHLEKLMTRSVKIGLALALNDMGPAPK